MTDLRRMCNFRTISLEPDSCTTYQSSVLRNVVWNSGELDLCPIHYASFGAMVLKNIGHVLGNFFTELSMHLQEGSIAHQRNDL